MSRKFRRGIPRAIAALAVFLAFFVLAAVLLGAEEESPAQGALLEDLPLSASLTLLAQEGDQAWLVFNAGGRRHRGGPGRPRRRTGGRGLPPGRVPHPV